MESSFIICIVETSKCPNRNLKSTVLGTGKYLIRKSVLKVLKSK